MTAVLDTTVIVNFGRSNALWLVERSLPSPVIVVDAVISEVRYPIATVAELQRALSAGWLSTYRLTTDDEIDWMRKLRAWKPRLGLGEAESLAVCLAHGWSLATDDRDARRIARDHGIVVTGTIGILIGAVEDAIIDRSLAEALFQRMRSEGFHAPITQLSDLLDQ